MRLERDKGGASGEGLLLLGIATAGITVILSAFSGYQQRAFDSYVHMFFADHYVRGWFDLWEPRWYGGFSVTSYPPLAHQVVAGLSLAIGLEPAFILVTAIAMFALPFAVGAAAQIFVDRRVALAAVFLAALWPTAARFAYVYGQLAMVVATPLALFSMWALDRFLRSGAAIDLALFMTLVGATAGAHHVSTIFVAGGCLLVCIRNLLRPAGSSGRARPFRILVLRGLAAGAAAAVGIAVVILPFWKFASAAPQVEIPHISRDPIWNRPFGMEVLEQTFIFFFTVVAGTVYAIRKRWTHALLALATLGLVVISTGATTPLPRLLFRSQWRWLTYDKFHHWAALLFVMLLAFALFDLGWLRRGVLALVAIVLLPATLLCVGHKGSDALQPEFIRDIEPVLTVLRGPEAERYRHLTLGFGDQFCRLDILGRSPNVDGDYHTARQNPILRQSGVGTLDATKYYPTGKDVLAQVLDGAADDSLRWVFVNDEWYYPIVLNAGFELKEIWRNGVVLFERDDVPPLPLPDPRPRTLWSYLWGLLPLACLAMATLLSAFALAGRLRELIELATVRSSIPQATAGE